MCHSDELVSLISAQFYYMPERYERVRVGCHCAKVKGHVELKIEKPRVKTFIYDFPKLHHSNPNKCFGVNVHLHQIKKRLRSYKGHVTSHHGQSIKNRRGTQGPPVLQIWCNSDNYFRSYGILNKNGAHHFFGSAAILKVLVKPKQFLNLTWVIGISCEKWCILCILEVIF